SLAIDQVRSYLTFKSSLALPLRVTAEAFVIISFAPCVGHPDLHSFPTRRSSDLFDSVTVPVPCLSMPKPPVILPVTPSPVAAATDRKSTRLNSSHRTNSYAALCV